MKQTIGPYTFLGLLGGALIATACSSSAPDSPDDQEPPLPAKAMGILPVNGETCAEYTAVNGSESKVSVLLTWASAAHTDQYRLEVLDEGTVIHTNSQTDLEELVELDRGKTYIWEVTTVNHTGETVGDSNSFTTPAIAFQNYAPYAAKIDMEFDASTGKLAISWVGSDEDNDTLTYNVKVYEAGLEILNVIGSENTELAPISFVSGLEYRVEVTSEDTSGNHSTSRWSETAP